MLLLCCTHHPIFDRLASNTVLLRVLFADKYLRMRTPLGLAVSPLALKCHHSLQAYQATADKVLYMAINSLNYCPKHYLDCCQCTALLDNSGILYCRHYLSKPHMQSLVLTRSLFLRAYYIPSCAVLRLLIVDCWSQATIFMLSSYLQEPWISFRILLLSGRFTSTSMPSMLDHNQIQVDSPDPKDKPQTLNEWLISSVSSN